MCPDSAPSRGNASLTLALDTGSPVASLALGRADGGIVERRLEGRAVSTGLLAELGALLEDCEAAWPDVQRILLLRGPGSFTGLRIGFAAGLGLHQASGPALVGLPTLRVLASWAMADATQDASPTVVALVDAMRGEWFVERFATGQRTSWPRSLGPTVRLSAAALLEEAPALWVGFGVARLWASLGSPAHVETREPLSLAAAALRLVALDPEAAEPMLTGDLGPEPLYLREAATTLTR